MKSLFLFALLLLISCEKKEEKIPPRSIYDQSVFKRAAENAVREEEAFACFKQEPFFNLLWENRSEEEGSRWLRKIKEEFPFLIERFDRFRLIDQIGSPRIYAYGDAGIFSPSTLRLAWITGDLLSKCGSWEDFDVVQIGAVHGSLCSALHAVAKWRTYTIIDLPEQLALAKKVVDQLELDHVFFLTPEQLVKRAVYDLVISDQSFSEFNSEFQELFSQNILASARAGYLLGHHFPKHFGVIPMRVEQLKHRLEKMGKKAVVEIEELARDREEYFIFWIGS